MERASLRQAFISVFILKSLRLSLFARDPGLGNSFTRRRKEDRELKGPDLSFELSALAALRDTSATQSRQESVTRMREDAKMRETANERIKICFDIALAGGPEKSSR